MKVAKIRFGVTRQVPVHEINPGVDSLFKTVTKRGKKIVSGEKELDEEVVEQLNQHKVRKVWINEAHYEWVSRREARERDPHLEEVQEVSVEVGKALLNLSEIETAAKLKEYLENYRSLEISGGLNRKCKNLLKEVEDLHPKIKKIRNQLKAVEEDKVQHKVMKELNKPPEEIRPDAVPQQCENLVTNYLEFLCEFYDLHFQTAGIVFEGGESIAEKFVD